MFFKAVFDLFPDFFNNNRLSFGKFMLLEVIGEIGADDNEKQTGLQIAVRFISFF